MKILEITNYTAGGCGVGMRVLKESQLLSARGHKVAIFSSNIVKGSEDLCSLEEKQSNVNIKRFPAMKLGGESYMHWNFTKEAIKYNPSVIIAHAYRHLHNLQALKVAKKLNCKIFLVTHAPFARETSRTWIQNKIVGLYDNLIGKNSLKRFDKIITITKWEEKYLEKLGIKKNKIIYLPNGVKDEFFKPIKIISKPITQIAYWGRISKIKQLESVSGAIALSINEDWTFKIRGPADKDYLKELNLLIKEKRLKDKEFIESLPYNSSEQIKGLDNSQIFILPSLSEGMPQTLVEAMARGRIVIGSDNEGNKELISDGKNGFIFKNGDERDLANILYRIKRLNQKEIGSLQKNARKTAERFMWNNIIQKIEQLISEK